MNDTPKRSNWKKSTLNLAAAAFSYLSSLLWFVAAMLSVDQTRTLRIGVGLLFLAQGFIWSGLGMRARKQGK